VAYLKQVLHWLLRHQVCAIYENFNFFQTPDEQEYPLEPDVALIKGVTDSPDISWRVGKDGPAPQVVFEIASEKTWARDLEEKPEQYAMMRVQEFYAYDPYKLPLPLSRRRGQRLFGWRLDPRTGQMRSMLQRTDGSLWSPHLESFLVPDGALLRLYDSAGNLRLTKGEADAHRADNEARRAEEAERKAWTEAERNRIFAEKLRSLGIDPEQLL
jgi:Uma2 family endonuclease